MAAECYCADSENGDHINDPSEDALFMLISDLNGTVNTFVVIQPVRKAAISAPRSLDPPPCPPRPRTRPPRAPSPTHR